MELLQLRYFCHAAHTENFTKTAEALRIPQSAVSRTVSTLEKELGCTLFDRAGKKVMLNERGRLFLHAVEKSLNGLDRVVEELSKSNEKTIKLQVLAGTKLIPNLLIEFSAHNPNIKFVLQQHSSEKDYDLRITAKECAPNHSCLTLMREKIVLAVPKNHRLYNRDVVDVEELRKERFVGLAKNKDLRAQVDAYCERHGFVPNVVIEAENAATFRSLVEQHSGIAFVPEKIFQSSPSKDLHFIPLRDKLERNIILEWRNNYIMDRQTKKFCDFAVAWFKERMLPEGKMYGSFDADLALGKPAFASSSSHAQIEGEVVANNLTDGNILNCFVSRLDDETPYFYVDLKEIHDINKVVLYFGSDTKPFVAAQAGAYELQVSNDGENWTTVVHVPKASYGKAVHTFDTVKARFVKVAVTEKWAGSEYVSMYEMQVFGTDFDSLFAKDEEKPMRILFIGNSLTCYYNVSSMVQSMFESTGKTVYIDVLLQMGKPLTYHASLPVTGKTILKGDYDYIVLQDKASEFDAKVLEEGAYNLYNNYISKGRAKPMLYMIWANEDVLVETQDVVTEGYVSTAKKIGAKVAPAGVCWLDFYQKGYNWYRDNVHANAIGAYMAAANIYYAISGETTPLKVKAGDEVIAAHNLEVELINMIHEKACAYTQQYNTDM